MHKLTAKKVMNMIDLCQQSTLVSSRY